MTIAEKIKLTLDRKGLTIRELAIAAKIPEQSLRSMLKRDDYKFSTLVQIAKALDYSFYELISSELDFIETVAWPTRHIPDEELELRKELEMAQKDISRLEEQVEDKRQIIEYLRKQLSEES